MPYVAPFPPAPIPMTEKPVTPDREDYEDVLQRIADSLCLTKFLLHNTHHQGVPKDWRNPGCDRIKWYIEPCEEGRAIRVTASCGKERLTVIYPKPRTYDPDCTDNYRNILDEAAQSRLLRIQGLLTMVQHWNTLATYNGNISMAASDLERAEQHLKQLQDETYPFVSSYAEHVRDVLRSAFPLIVTE